jgi:hypothetical protein
MERVTGRVTRDTFAAGSKSERPGIFLESGDRRYLLRRVGGNPLADPVLDGLVGRTVMVEGEIRGYILLVARWADAQAD